MTKYVESNRVIQIWVHWDPFVKFGYYISNSGRSSSLILLIFLVNVVFHNTFHENVLQAQNLTDGEVFNFFPFMIFLCEV